MAIDSRKFAYVPGKNIQSIFVKQIESMIRRPIYLLTQNCRLFFFICFLSGPVRPSTGNITRESTASPSGLSNPFSPQTFNLHLEFTENLETRRYEGKSIIGFTVPGDADTFIVNAQVTEITAVDLVSTAGEGSIYANHTYAKDEGLIYVNVTKTLQKGPLYHLTVNFVGEIRTDFSGFYLVSYLNDYNETEYMLSTNFKPNHARKAFPCLDAPYYRALFYLDVVHSKHYKAVSNRERKKFEIINDTIVHTTFEGTALLPAYQISLTLMRFKSVSFERVFDYTAYGRHDGCGLLFSLTASTRFLPNMFNYLSNGNLQNKLDIVAIPTDMDVLGDDNLNTAIYCEHDIELSDTEQTVMEQMEILIRIGRAIAHHNFGFHLAPETWWDLWLSDGFANWFAYKSAKEIFPDWSVDEFFMVLEYQKALHLDNDESSIAVVPQPTENSAEVPVYSPIFSAKAASVLRMLENGFGSEYFSSKIEAYSDHTSLVSTESFFKFFLDGVSIDPVLLMRWVSQPGYPLITVIRNFTGGNETVHLTQKPISSTDLESTWWIPFNIISRNNPNFEITEFDGALNPEGDINPSSISWKPDDWIVVNSQATGFHRTNYDSCNWRLLTEALWQNPEIMHVNNRAQLLDDAFRLAEEGVLSFEVPLNLSVYLKNETEFAPWAVAYNFFTTLQVLFVEVEEINLLRYYIQEITNEPYTKVGFTESISDVFSLRATRGIVTQLACQVWNENCVCTAHQIFYEFMHNDRPIRPDLRKTVLCTSIGFAPRQDLEWIWKKFFRNRQRTAREKLVFFLGCSKDEGFLLEIIQRIFDWPPPTDYSQHERNRIIPEIVDKGSVAVLACIKVLKKSFYQKVLHSESMLIAALEKVAEYVFTEEGKELFNDLLDDALKSHFISQSQYGAYLKKVHNNLKWVYGNHDEILWWLRHFKETTSNNETYVVQEPICEPGIDPVCDCGCGCDENHSAHLEPSKPLQIVIKLFLFTYMLLLLYF